MKTVLQQKNTYSAKALADMGLEGLPTAANNMRALADREKWAFVEVTGRGGKRREYTPPAYVANAIKAKLVESVMGAVVVPASNLPAAVNETPVHLTGQQAQVEGARRAVLLAIDRLVEKANVSREAAMTSILTAAKAGGLEPQLEMALRLGRDNRGGKGDLYPSIRTIKGWRAAVLDGESLAPAGCKALVDIPVWADAFLYFYQQPQKPSVATAYESFIESDAVQKLLQNGLQLPSVHQCRRFLDKMGNVSREVGRMGSHDLRNIKGFKRRRSNHLMPNEVWTADGHKFDAEVAHPMHKRPMRPEVTAIVDVATRKVVGWSVSLAESGFAVLDAIRHGVVTHGLPAIFYVDNGSGYVNAMMTDKSVGLMGRLGVTMENSIAYNSQARGVIEASHKNLIKLAQKMPTFIGAKMDRQAKLLAYKTTRKAVKTAANGAKGETVKTPLMPWDVFVQYLKDGMDKYNNKPHRTLKGFSPNQVWDKKLGEGFEAMAVNEAEAAYLFRPQVERTVQRCEVSLFANTYYAKELEEFHRDRVKVAFDIHDGSQIWVYTLDDQLICTAGFEANATDYFPKSAVAHAADKRMAGREKRLELQLDEVHAERGGNRFIEMGEAQRLDLQGLMNADKKAFAYVEPMPAIEVSPVPPKTLDVAQADDVWAVPNEDELRYAEYLRLTKLLNIGGSVSEHQQRWLRMYPNSVEFKLMTERHKKAS